MEYVHLAFFVVTSLFLVSTIDGSGSCYKFPGDGRVSFVDNIDISARAHFKLTFKTISDSGVLYYAEGTHHRERVFDYEGVFLRDGHLHYFLFNPGEYSIGSSFGFYGNSTVPLNDGKWHTVEFYRNREVSTVAIDGTTTTENQTGLAVDGVTQAMDNKWRKNVNIFQPIILGQDPHMEESSNIGGFKGRIKDFEEVSQDHKFDQENTITGTVTHCLTLPDAPDAV